MPFMLQSDSDINDELYVVLPGASDNNSWPPAINELQEWSKQPSLLLCHPVNEKERQSCAQQIDQMNKGQAGEPSIEEAEDGTLLVNQDMTDASPVDPNSIKMIMLTQKLVKKVVPLTHSGEAEIILNRVRDDDDTVDDHIEFIPFNQLRIITVDNLATFTTIAKATQQYIIDQQHKELPQNG